MNRTTKRQMTIERHTVTIIRTKGDQRPVFCRQCQKLITNLIPEQIVDPSQIEVKNVHQQNESEHFHLIQTEDGEE